MRRYYNDRRPEIPVKQELLIPQNTIRLLDENKGLLGVMATGAAKAIARERELDLIPLNPNGEVPVYMLGDYNKYMYNLNKSKKAQEKKNREMARTSEEKEVHLPCDITPSSENDRNRVLTQANEFLAAGHRVKIQILFIGRKVQRIPDMMPKFQEEIAEKVTAGNIISVDTNYNKVNFICMPDKKAGAKSKDKTKPNDGDEPKQP